MKVDVYFNLHRSCWSVRDSATKLIIGYAQALEVSEARCVVSEAGRQRVLRERKKNVHAFIKGNLVAAEGFEPRGSHAVPEASLRPINAAQFDAGDRISYNPYAAGHFYNKRTGEPVGALPAALLRSDRSVLAAA